MMTAVRSSKRFAVGAFLGLAFLLLCLLALKDLSDKLNVMTASNAGYQKMTDSQVDKIKALTSELEVCNLSKAAEVKSLQEEARRQEKRFNDLKDKLNALNIESQRCHGQLNDLTDVKTNLESDRDELKRQIARHKSDSDAVSVQLRDQIARISLDRDSCHHQYDALFKLHQAASDDVASLNQDKERLALQLTDVTAKSSSTFKVANKPQIQVPNRPQQRSSSVQPVGLEQPHMPQKLSTSKGASPHLAAAVAAEPPHGNSPEFVPVHQVRKEDVMEAPKINRRFENLDAQVDPHDHDHPGLLPAPVYNQNVALEEDDIEDSADGQLPVEYNDGNKVAA